MYAKSNIHSAMMYAPGVAGKAAEHLANMSTRNANGDLTFDPMAHIEERCGRYTRGKHKGELRGMLEVLMVDRGGWKKNGPGYMNGGVVYPGSILGFKITGWTGEIYVAAGRSF